MRFGVKRALIQSSSILKIAIPMVLTNLVIVLAGIVDTAVMGHQSSPLGLAAVSLGALAFSAIFWLFNFLRMAATGIVANQSGARDFVGMRRTFIQGMSLSCLMGVCLLGLQAPFTSFSFFLLKGGSSEVLELAHHYFHIRLYVAPFILMLLFLMGWLLGMGKPRYPMIMLFVGVIINIALNFLFVFYYQWGVQGLALATAIGDLSAFFVGMWGAHQVLKGFPAKTQTTLELLKDTRAFRFFFSLSGDIFIRTICLQFVFFFVAGKVTNWGEETIAAHGVLMSFFQVMAFGLDGFANATEVRAGENLGAKKRHPLRRTIRYTASWSVLFGIAISLSYATLGPLWIRTLTSIHSVQAIAETYYLWMVVMPLFACWSFWLDGLYLGAMRGRELRDGMIFSVLCFLGAWWGTESWGYHGLWFSLILFMLVRAISLTWLLKKRPLL